mmetsp:Transcript_28882/g.51479  ORF Transcript_28882/g.51479 Transcript_28882/m.51479 type:complete len:479 (-) Transcript_28882:2384-3820(-)
MFRFTSFRLSLNTPSLRNMGSWRKYAPQTQRSEDKFSSPKLGCNPLDLLTEQYVMPELPHSKTDIKEFLKANSISIKGVDDVSMISNFNDLKLPEAITDLLNKNFEQPTPIQKISLPVALSGQDMIGVSQTGSGKTLSFILPSIMHILNRLHENKAQFESPLGLVLAPTRELAEQIRGECKPYFYEAGLFTTVITGGSSRSYQVAGIGRKPQMLIATPGRLNDLIESNEVSVENISFLVLDEADRMLDMGFEDQIRTIIRRTQEDRQTLMWSATWPKEVRYLAEDFLASPAYLQVGSRELTANSNIKQVFERVHPEDKFATLMTWINKIKEENGKVLIFLMTKRGVAEIRDRLANNGIDAVELQGDMEQRSRSFSLASFRRSTPPFMIATDVAARGLDIKDITHVINYDMPQNTEDYIHRIGRTARGAASGTSISFFTDKDRDLSSGLVEILKETKQEVPNFLSQPSPSRSSGGRGRK